MEHCVYCGKPFCDRHGEQGADYTSVCDRKTCQAKFRDVADHLMWKTRVYEFNRVSICAQDDCQDRMHHICSRCRLLFCAAHVKEQQVLNTTVRPHRKEIQIICVHCRARRSLWD